VQDHLAEIQSQPEKPWLKIALFSVLGLVLVGIIALATTQISKKQAPQITIQPVPTFTPIATPTLNLDSTANWKTYTNTKYGYSIRYPDDLLYPQFAPGVDIRPDSVAVSFILVKYKNQQRGRQSQQQPQIGIEVFPDEGLLFGEWWDKHSTDKLFTYDNTFDNAIHYFGVKDIGQAHNGLEWWTFSSEWEGIEKNNKMINRNGNIYDLYYKNALGEDLKPIFNLVLSTFKFLDQSQADADEVAGWKTYIGVTSILNNGPQGRFSIKYPSNWENEGSILYPFGKNEKARLLLGASALGGPIPYAKKVFPSGEANYVWMNDSSDNRFIWARADFLIKNTTYSFELNDLPVKYKQEFQETFDQILSTFRFLPSGNSGQEE
jgi:hypothetical protein